MNPMLWFLSYIGLGVFIAAIYYSICATQSGNTDSENAGAAIITALFWPFMLIATVGLKIGEVIKKSSEK